MRNDMNGPLPNGAGHGCANGKGVTNMPKKPSDKNKMDFVVSGKTILQFMRMRVMDVGNGGTNAIKAHKAEKASMMPLKAAKALMQWMIDTQTFWAAWTNATDWYGEKDITKVANALADAMKDLRPLTMDAKELKAYETKMADLESKLADLLAEKAALDQL